MFLTLYATLALAQQTGAQVEAPTGKASEIITKMLAHYADAKTVAGGITLTQSAQNVQVKILTQMQFDKPDRIYIFQTLQATASEPAQNYWLSSDGKTFNYSRPPKVYDGPDVFREYVTQHGVSQDTKMMYTAARHSFRDPNAMMEIAIGRKEDLEALMAQWATMRVYGQVDWNGEKVTAIVGDYREKADVQPTGSFEVYVNGNYDFVRYVVKERFGVPGHSEQTVEVTSIWDSTLKVGVKTDPSLYKG